MHNFCLVPMKANEIQKLLGKDFVNTFQKEMDLIISPLRKYIAKGYPLALGKEQWEYVVSESIVGADWCGAGKSIIDVKVGNIGIDVKGVSKEHNSNATTEASMFQTFKEETKAYFNSNDTKSIWNLFVDGWIEKVKSVKEYYLIGIVREKETLNCSLCCFKVAKTDLLYEDALCQFTKKSMKVSGIADPEFIETRVYSSKTRLEMKFKSKVWKDPKYCLQIYKF
jgi:hypothetical protein